MAKPKKDAARPLGCGVFAVYKRGVPRRIEFRSLPIIRKKLGDAQLVGFVRAFNAAERMQGFVHLMRLNREHLDDRSIASDRNHRLLAFMTFGTLYEAMLALDVLSGAGIKARVGRESAAWAALDKMRKRWDKNRLLGVFRHKFAHHLGDHADVVNGLDRLGNRRTVMFETEREGTLLDSTFPFAFDVILRGAELDSDEFMSAASQAVDDQGAFVREIQVLLGEALTSIGVQFSPPPGD